MPEVFTSARISAQELGNGSECVVLNLLIGWVASEISDGAPNFLQPTPTLSMRMLLGR